MPERREEDARATGRVSLLEDVGSKARRRIEEVIWLGLALALLRKKTNEEWTEKHRNVSRKLLLEGGCVQKKLFDTGWSDESECQACHKEEFTEKHRLYHSPELYEVKREIPEAFRKWEQKARTSKNERKWHRGIVTHPLSESQWNRGHFRMKKWESEMHKTRACRQKSSKARQLSSGKSWKVGSMWLVSCEIGL